MAIFLQLMLLQLVLSFGHFLDVTAMKGRVGSHTATGRAMQQWSKVLRSVRKEAMSNIYVINCYMIWISIHASRPSFALAFPDVCNGTCCVGSKELLNSSKFGRWRPATLERALLSLLKTSATGEGQWPHPQCVVLLSSAFREWCEPSDFDHCSIEFCWRREPYVKGPVFRCGVTNVNYRYLTPGGNLWK